MEAQMYHKGIYGWIFRGGKRGAGKSAKRIGDKSRRLKRQLKRARSLQCEKTERLDDGVRAIPFKAPPKFLS
jgi:hypothetical protein